MVIKPSLRFALLLLLFHMATAISVYVTAVPAVAKVLTIVLITLSLVYYLARDVFLVLPASWREISLGQGGVSVIARDGSSFLAQIAHTTVVSPYGILLRTRLAGHRLLISRIIFPDALGVNEFREPCVRLRFA